ncbi:MAG: phosphatidate cytidylyltransferase [Chitinophagaceae bacterium]|nr:phosphatidate cytidylyltransferase [Chitinophagaceae bacterium]MBP6047785.1 phosphatidate cytidylyltransferase [Ferruginibacter sp.]NMD29791.1 phosphatidate cytidylyltransferase [Bacteroidota bacterium]MBK7088766.1 phosphatidate cytidylyltransferase [Chitinophagaceae bacterium]MBK7734685.1 phosphatidate cytidylyltransferase [Chitinophagaceae bacterium]
MALNKAVFKTRTISAIVFAAVLLLGLLWNYWFFITLFCIIHFGCWYEFIKLVKKIYGNKSNPCYFFGFLYITLPILMLVDLATGIRFFALNHTQQIFFNKVIPCAIIFSIWINDTMAYIVGSLIGKTPFSKISPKKTWEGTIGGMVLCVLLIGIAARFLPVAKEMFAVKHWVTVAMLCAIFGTLGDLLESKLKRMANVKDSGSFMPGHGGFLDRFDSLLIATPAVWLYLKLIALVV